MSFVNVFQFVCVPFHFGFEGGMVDLIVLVLIITFLYTFQVRIGICLYAFSELQPVYTIYLFSVQDMECGCMISRSLPLFHFHQILPK